MGNKNIFSNCFVIIYINCIDWCYGLVDVILEGICIINIGVFFLIWEIMSSYDVGVDFGLWDGRVVGLVVYYQQNVLDLLLVFFLVIFVGLQGNNIWGNIGDMFNWGVELELNFMNIWCNDFIWIIDFNIIINCNWVDWLIFDLDCLGCGLLSGNWVF